MSLDTQTPCAVKVPEIFNQSGRCTAETLCLGCTATALTTAPVLALHQQSWHNADEQGGSPIGFAMQQQLLNKAGRLDLITTCGHKQALHEIPMYTICLSSQARMYSTSLREPLQACCPGKMQIPDTATVMTPWATKS